MLELVHSIPNFQLADEELSQYKKDNNNKKLKIKKLFNISNSPDIKTWI